MAKASVAVENGSYMENGTAKAVELWKNGCYINKWENRLDNIPFI